MRRRLALLLLVVLAALGLWQEAAAQYFGQNKVQYRRYEWISITSDHYEVYFYPGLDSLAMRVMDLAEKTSLVLSKRMGHTLGRRIPIILYGSHNDFAQTNITPEPIDASTGGFTEVLRNRVVLPFTGSYEDLRHVVVHELTHAFMFDMLYGGSAAALIARQSFFSVPLWFAEGIAEYYSLGIEPNAEMFLRDGIVEGYLPPLMYSGSYLVYKQGQSAISYLVGRYGEDRLRDVLKRIRQMRNFERAFQRSMGMPVGKFDEQWRTWLRKEYWPTVANKEDPERFARRLTDHRRDESHFNTSPAVSPQGDRIAYFSDRRQYTDVYLMSAIDGKVLRRLVRAERSVAFEAVPSFGGALAWSPDGERLAMTAKSAGRHLLYVVSTRDGKVEKRFELPCESLNDPAWSPVSDSIVVTGTLAGRSDLWLVDAGDGRIARLTDDTWDEKDPTWTPDGRTVTFSSDRGAPVVLSPMRQERGFGAYAIFGLDVERRQVTLTVDTHGDDTQPAWSPDGEKLAFVSERSGAPNIFLFQPADSSFTQLTDVLGGIQSLSWSHQNDRLVFSAFNRGGYDVFAVKEPLSVDGVLARLRRQAPHAVFTAAEVRASGADTVVMEPTHAALAGAWPDTLSRVTDSLAVALSPTPPTLEASGTVDTLGTLGTPPPPDYEPPGAPTLSTHPGDRSLAVRDTVSRLATTIPLVERGGPFALPDSVLGQKPSVYKVRLAPDYAGGGFYASSGFGFVGSTQFVFSDFLGDHNLFVATDVFSNSFEETNALTFYSYLPRRWDFGVGLFHFKNYFSSRVTTLGEQLNSARLFSDRNFGLLVSASYPFDRFRRVEFNYTQMFVDRQFFREDELGAIVAEEKQFRSVSSPSLSLIGDNALFGYYGPVNGGRYNFTASPSFGWFRNGLSYQTVTLDARRYWDLTHGYTFAARVLGGWSGGHDPQIFQIGGFSTLRGYSDFDSSGSRVAVANLELRFPFIQQLGLVGPVPLGIFNLRGAVFTDFGAVWDEGETMRFMRSIDGRRRLDTPMMGFGTGIRTVLYFFILKLDVAWNTDLVDVSRPRWHVSLGPEF